MRAAALGLLLVAAAPAGAEAVLEAEFAAPTDRYAHAILGDALEWGAPRMRTATGWRRLTLPEDHVFEDLAPRLWDLTGDGQPEVVVIETDVALGAALAVYGPDGKLAETPHIGRTHRWLAPIAAADLDGDGRIEVAYIDRPHLAKVLRIWRWEGEGLVPLADLPGLTNHRIGEEFLTSGLRDCGTGPELVTVNADWSHLMVTRADGGGFVSYPVTPFTGPASLADMLACEAGAG